MFLIRPELPGVQLLCKSREVCIVFNSEPLPELAVGEIMLQLQHLTWVVNGQECTPVSTCLLGPLAATARLGVSTGVLCLNIYVLKHTLF